MNKRIILSLATVGVALAAVSSATLAYFTDSETSTGNVLSAGAIDLEIDNESYYNGVYGVDTSWGLDDLDGNSYLFFDFADLKPGDWGEDTISVHVNDNNSWVCMDLTITSTPENDVTEPEALVDGTVGVDEGELQEELNFIFWADDGDNVLEVDEAVDGIFINDTLSGISGTGSIALADSSVNVWLGQGSLEGDTTRYIAKAWCFGSLSLAPVDIGEDPTVDPGITCDGELVTNVSQTDGVVVNVNFEAVQSRNNDSFLCSPE